MDSLCFNPCEIYRLNNSKVLTVCLADHFSSIHIRLAVTYLQFPIQVCLSAAVGHLSSCWAAVFLLWPWTLTYNLDRWAWPRKCLSEPGHPISRSQRSLRWEVIFGTYTRDRRDVWTTKAVSKLRTELSQAVDSWILSTFTSYHHLSTSSASGCASTDWNWTPTRRVEYTSAASTIMSMSVLVILGRKCTLATSRAAFGESRSCTLSMRLALLCSVLTATVHGRVHGT